MALIDIVISINDLIGWTGIAFLGIGILLLIQYLREKHDGIIYDEDGMSISVYIFFAIMMFIVGIILVIWGYEIIGVNIVK